MSETAELARRASRLLQEAGLSSAGFDFGLRLSRLAEALSLYRLAGDQRKQVEVLAQLSGVARNMADFEASLAYLDEAERLSRKIDHPALARDVESQHLSVLLDLADHEGALALARRMVDDANRGTDAETMLMAHNALGCSEVQAGEIDAGIEHLEQSMVLIDQIPDESRRSYLRAQATADLADAYLGGKRPAEALASANEAERLAADIGHRALRTLSGIYAGQAALALGDAEDARKRLDAAAKDAGAMGLRTEQCRALQDLGRALAALGRYEEAFSAYTMGHAIEREARREQATRRLEFRRGQRELEQARREKENAERILHAVLPRPIAERIARGESRIAEDLPDVSVLFADIVGFTPLAKVIGARDVVALLETVFSEFDRLTALHGLEKIKTIGDAYMAVGGALGRADNHLVRSAQLALSMVETLRRIAAKSGAALEIRIGLHAGPAVGGVIGSNRLSYDLWGETINLASRLESSGEPGRVHVSASAAGRLHGDMDLAPRGRVPLKGLGEVETYWVLRQKAAR